MVHQPVSRGLAVFADAWLLGWLAEISADLRENGSALEIVSRRCAIQIHDFTLLHASLPLPGLHKTTADFLNSAQRPLSVRKT